ncbi:hypothetical protein [Acidocella facilis]|uniref:hypothetical protein n=1 Tax=Acidocella facilis TaxID=525 RepID=UPI001F33C3BB|nr:hypothetical protein [Acidocella facilis]
MAKPKDPIALRTRRLRLKYRNARRWHSVQMAKLDAIWLLPPETAPEAVRLAALERLEKWFAPFFAAIPPDTLNRED